MKKVVITILNPGSAPADNGRTIHALKLGKGLIEGGAEVRLVFAGEGVKWVPRFENRSEDSHPFVKHYGHVYDELREHVVACNMCCHRFDTFDVIEKSDIPILGEHKEHVDIARWVLEGYEVMNF